MAKQNDPATIYGDKDPQGQDAFAAYMIALAQKAEKAAADAAQRIEEAKRK